MESGECLYNVGKYKYFSYSQGKCDNWVIVVKSKVIWLKSMRID